MSRRPAPARARRINAADPEEGPAVWIVTGIPGAGTAAVGRNLAERMPRSAHVRADVLGAMVVGGAARVTARPSAEAVRQLRLRHRLGALVADAYARAGFHVVLGDVVLGAELPALVAALRTRPAFCVVLTPSLAAVRARAARRGAACCAGAGCAALDRTLRRETPRLGLWLDTSDRSAAATVDEILARREEARLG